MKDQTTQLPNKVDDVLQRIEKRERNERRKRFVLILAIFALLGASIVGYRMIGLTSGPQLRTYAVTDLNYEQVKHLLAENQQPLLVTHPDIGSDTIRSADDYVNLRSILDLIEGSRQPAMFVNDQGIETAENDQATEETISGDLPTFIVDVEGQRESGQELIFAIENYNSEVTYLLDFGNGYRRRVGRRTTYTYPSKGRFRLRLMATSVNRGTSVYTKPIQIDQGSAPVPVQVATNEQQPEALATNENEVASSPDTPNSDSVSPPDISLRRPSLIEPPASLLADNSSDLILNNPAPVKVPETKPAAAAAPAKPLMTSEVAPEFPGGSRGMARYFRRNYRYPATAQNNAIEGVVYVRFVVNADGSLSDFNLLKGIGYGCDEEAMRLIRNMPDWNPGEMSGQKVPVYKTIPITFKLIR